MRPACMSRLSLPRTVQPPRAQGIHTFPQPHDRDRLIPPGINPEFLQNLDQDILLGKIPFGHDQASVSSNRGRESRATSWPA